MFKIVSAKQALFIVSQLQLVVDEYLTSKGWHETGQNLWRHATLYPSLPLDRQLTWLEALNVQQAFENGVADASRSHSRG